VKEKPSSLSALPMMERPFSKCDLKSIAQPKAATK